MLIRKGQVFTPDFSASVALFSLFLIVFGVIWNASLVGLIQDGNGFEMNHRYGFSLLQTTGSPESWNRSNVEIPGLYSEGYLSAEKFDEFFDLGVSRQRQLLRTQEFQLEIRYLNGSLVEYDGDHLDNLTAYSNSEVPPSKNVYTSRQVSVLKENGKKVEMRYNTWEN